jgi:dihydrolipoamide dehydrogenase
MKNFDLCVIGGGPGGYVAAIRASQLGLNVALIEANHLGGICLNWGCIPTKALLRSSEINHLLHNLEEFGFSADNIKFDFKKVIERSRKVSKQLNSGVKGLLKKNKVQIFDNFAKIESKGKIGLYDTNDHNKKIEDISAKNTILATGARARTIPGIEPDKDYIWTYREAMTPEKMPKSLVIIGSGAIGVEFASFYKNMGADVTIVEMADNILPVEDEEISKAAKKSFEKQGIKIHTKAALKEIVKNKDKTITAKVEIKGKIEEINAEKAILAIGIVPNTENIGLEKTGIKLEKSFIKTDKYLETNEKTIYAIGDVTSAPWLAHKASHEGVIAAEKIASDLGKYKLKDIHTINVENIPGCTYSYPQIASVGLTEKKAAEQKLKVKIGRFPYIANGKAIAMGETDGLIKTIFDEKTGELLGAHIIGSEATEMIQGYVIGKQAELTEIDFIQTIFPHPTQSEMMHESVLDAYNKAIHF